MNNVKIIINNPIFSEAKEGIDLIKPILSYETFTIRNVIESNAKGDTWKRKKKQYFNKSCISKDGLFYTGWIERIKDYCVQKGYELEIEESEEHKIINDVSHGSYIIDGINLRPDQIDTVERILKAKRGILLATMRYGKSFVAASILKAYENHNALILCNRTSILSQLRDDLVKYGLDAEIFKKNNLNHKILLSTMATLNNINLNELIDYWKVVIIDEAHIGMGFSSMGEKIMSSLIAPVKIGLTGTLPSTDEAQMALEGLVGPVIKHVSFEEGNELGILTKAKLKLIPVEKCRKLEGLTKYKDIYKTGIVEYRRRNQLICEEIKKLNDIGKSVLVFVTDLDHVNNLLQMTEAYGINRMYVDGSIDDENRNILKEKLQNKECLCLISTVVFREGITIGSLDCVMIAFGGRSSTALQQALGRCLGQWKDKEDAIIIDMLDIARYLSEHTVERIQLYKSLGLIGE